jgi:Lipid A 3-O-deacylase (PagL)
MGGVHRVYRVALNLTAAMALVATLALPGTLEGQSADCQILDRRVCPEKLETRNSDSSVIADLGLLDNAQAQSTGTGETSERVGDLHTEASCSNLFSMDVPFCSGMTDAADSTSVSTRISSALEYPSEPVEDGDTPNDDSKPALPVVQRSNLHDFGRSVFYKNKIEFSLDSGWLPINIPFVFDVFLGDGYTKTPLNYTLVPIIASLRWQVDDVGGPWIFRGNWDVEASAAVTLIPKGPESRYIAWIMGFRRNFVPHRGKIAPYFDGRLGLGNIDAKEPAGVLFAQGQDFTFTMNMGSGIRYNFNPRYSISAGLNWMHISNLYLSEPKFANYGINVYGPMFGVNIFLGRLGHHHSE